jgi:hypothetical protein
MFFSCRKVGGLFSTAFVFMSEEFYNEIGFASQEPKESMYDNLNQEFLDFTPGTFDVGGFIVGYN